MQINPSYHQQLKNTGTLLEDMNNITFHKEIQMIIILQSNIIKRNKSSQNKGKVTSIKKCSINKHEWVTSNIAQDQQVQWRVPFSSPPVLKSHFSSIYSGGLLNNPKQNRG